MPTCQKASGNVVLCAMSDQGNAIPFLSIINVLVTFLGFKLNMMAGDVPPVFR